MLVGLLSFPIFKWFLTLACLAFGIQWCRAAYLKRHEFQPFRIGDLFANLRSRDKSKQQLLLEGLLAIGLGVGCIVILLFGHP